MAPAQGCLEPQKLEEVGRALPSYLQGSTALPTPGFCGRINPGVTAMQRVVLGAVAPGSKCRVRLCPERHPGA